MPPGRTPWNWAFFEERKLTSALKHLILKRYVKEFAYHLGTRRGTVYYVDGFAGRGIYKAAGGGTYDGSPLLIARLAETIRTSPRPFALKCLNVERNPASCRELERVTAPFKPHIVEKNYPGEFTDALPDILTRTQGFPAFFFIDPFGTKGIPFDKLRPIFRRSATTEVFITLHTDGITKKAGNFASVNDPNPRRAFVARALTDHLAAALDVRPEELLSLWRECAESGGTMVFERRVLDRYLHILRYRTGFRFVKACPVFYYRPDTPPGSEAPVCFHLVFATRKDEGLFELNDAMVEALDEFYEERNWEPLFPTFRRQVEKTRDIQALKKAIVAKFASPTFTIPDAKRVFMQGDSPFLITGGDYRKAVLQLLKEGIIERLDGKRTPPGNTTPLRVKK